MILKKLPPESKYLTVLYCHNQLVIHLNCFKEISIGIKLTVTHKSI